MRKCSCDVQSASFCRSGRLCAHCSCTASPTAPGRRFLCAKTITDVAIIPARPRMLSADRKRSITRQFRRAGRNASATKNRGPRDNFSQPIKIRFCTYWDGVGENGSSVLPSTKRSAPSKSGNSLLVSCSMSGIGAKTLLRWMPRQGKRKLTIMMPTKRGPHNSLLLENRSGRFQCAHCRRSA